MTLQQPKTNPDGTSSGPTGSGSASGQIGPTTCGLSEEAVKANRMTNRNGMDGGRGKRKIHVFPIEGRLPNRQASSSTEALNQTLVRQVSLSVMSHMCIFNFYKLQCFHYSISQSATGQGSGRQLDHGQRVDDDLLFGRVCREKSGHTRAGSNFHPQ